MNSTLLPYNNIDNIDNIDNMVSDGNLPRARLSQSLDIIDHLLTASPHHAPHSTADMVATSSMTTSSTITTTVVRDTSSSLLSPSRLLQSSLAYSVDRAQEYDVEYSRQASGSSQLQGHITRSLGPARRSMDHHHRFSPHVGCSTIYPRPSLSPSFPTDRSSASKLTC